MSNTCDLCGVNVPEGSGHTFELTPEERATLSEDSTSFVYCDPCYRLTKDPQAMVSLIASVVDARLRQFGASPQQSSLDQYKAKLLELALAKKG